MTQVDQHSGSGPPGTAPAVTVLWGLGVALLWWVVLATVIAAWAMLQPDTPPDCSGWDCGGAGLVVFLLAVIAVPAFLVDMLVGAVVLTVLRNRLRYPALAGTAVAWIGITAGLLAWVAVFVRQ